jgi:hypothetical protein
LARRAAPALLVLAFAIGGCGEGGASAGATVSAYVAAPLCREAQRQLSREAGSVEDLHVRVVCLPPVESAGRVDLARSGANARRATEDSTSVAYLEAPGRAAEFGEAIVESAGIAWLEAASGSTAMRRVLKALGEAGSSSPREAVRETLGG